MFVFKAQSYLDELNRNEPELFACAKRAYDSSAQDQDFIRLDKQTFSQCKSTSIDYAVMENTDKGAVVTMDAGWNDIGAWDSLCDILPKDDHGNVFQGPIINEGATNTLAISSERKIALLGLSDIVVIETGDAVLVADKSKVQDVKKIILKLDEK